MADRKVEAVIVQPSLPLEHAAELALRYRLPATAPVATFPELGGLMAYMGKREDTFRDAAFLVDKILKGAKPADLPIQQPTKFALVVNMKTAKALGLTLPPLFRVRIDETIE